MPAATLPAAYASALGLAVTQARHARRLSVAALADRAGVSRITVHALERDGGGSLALLLAVAGALETTPAKLLARAETILRKMATTH